MTDWRSDWPSVNELASPLVQALIQDAESLGISVAKRPNGCTVIDAGIECDGSYEAGRQIAEIGMAGLGEVFVDKPEMGEDCWLALSVETDSPVLSCLGSQYAGWSLEYADPKYYALGSGPARALAIAESLFEHLRYKDQYDESCLVIETSDFPPDGLIEKIATKCSIKPDQLTLVLTPTGSLAGVTQIAARVVEVAMHKAHELKFDISTIVSASGTALIAPPCDDFLTAMGRTNDSILYGGEVSLDVSCSSTEAQELAENLPSNNSPDYGTPFAEIFKKYEYDFYQIDPMLFSPASVSVYNFKTDERFSRGVVNRELLEKSFGS